MKSFIILLTLFIILTPKLKGEGEWYYFDTPDNLRPGAGSALTYGRRPDEEVGKLFYLIDNPSSASYYFYWAHAYYDPNQPMYLDWEELSAPNPGISPQSDGAICYFYDDVRHEEKILAIFGGCDDVWCYDVAGNTWTKDGPIPGYPVDEGGSMEFWGFREIYGYRVPSFFLIKGGGNPAGYEFWRYNRGPMQQPPRGRSEPFPYWERLAPFNIYGYDEPFCQGADLALYYPDPYSSHLHDTIYAMCGNGDLFGHYRISQNIWYPNDNLISAALLGGALVSHPKWETIGDEPEDTSSTDNEDWSILHQFKGGRRNYFNCFELTPQSPNGVWNYIPDNPEDVKVESGSDLVYGACWYQPSPSIIRNGIWASFGSGGSDSLGFYLKTEFPGQGSGGQSFAAFEIGDKEIIVLPNPVKSRVSFEFTNSVNDAKISIYSNNGRMISCLKSGAGRCVWNLKDKNGKTVPNGIYFYTIRTDNKEKIGKLVLSK